MREPSQYEAPSCATIGGDFWFPDNESGIPGASTVDATFAKNILIILTQLYQRLWVE